ncbi:MAG: TonB-dependent receptor [Saprospiraceae bacterium]|nr:TonB-dependent receptor [Lewinella sp.]
MKHLSLQVLFILLIGHPIFFSSVHGQNMYGYVKDQKTGESLIGVNIYAPEAQIGTTTNTFGYFQITTSGQNTIHLRLSYVGYETIDTTLAVALSQNMIIKMSANANLPEIEVTGDQSLGEGRQLGKVVIPMEQLNKVPPLLGEVDPFKALALTPGIANGVEGTSDLYIRGGTPDQNLILYDGAKVYNANHLFGFLSPFNPDIVKDIKVYKGAFPSRFGGRLSSVVDVTGKEGNKNKTVRKATIGLINTRLLLEGPWVKDKLSYTLGARSSHLATLLLFSDQSYYFYDLNGKLNYKTDRSNLSFSAYSSWDKWTVDLGNKEQASKLHTSWGNKTASLRYARDMGSRLFVQGLVTFNHYQYGIQQNLDERDTTSNSILSRSFIQEWDGKVDADYRLTKNWGINWGIEAGLMRINPRSVETSTGIGSITQTAVETERILRLAPYLENSFSISDNLQVTLGGRYAIFKTISGNRYAYLEPRVSLDYDWNGYHVKAAYAKMNQPLHLLTGNFIGVSNNIWVGASATAAPQSVEHFSLGVEKKVSKALFASAELYYKRFERLVDPLPGVSFLQTDFSQWEDIAGLNGQGRVAGLELFLRYKHEHFFGWLAYTLSISKVRFDEINGGNWYFRTYDRRHDLSITGGYQLGNNWEFLSTFVLNSGNRLTLPTSLYYDPLSRIPVGVYRGRNNEKTPIYHRLDISFRHHRVWPSGKERTFNVGIYNVYARKNPFYVIAEPDLNFDNLFDEENRKLTLGNQVKQFSLFNLIPFVNYTFTF